MSAKDQKYHCPVLKCKYVGTTYEITNHLQDLTRDKKHRNFEVLLEQEANDAYILAEVDWVDEHCKKVIK